MGGQTRNQIRSAYVTAVVRKNHDGVSAAMLDAVEYDAAHPGEPRLMDEIRADQRLTKVAS